MRSVITLLQAIAIVAVTIPLSLAATVFAQWHRMHTMFFQVARLWGRIVMRIVGITIVVRGPIQAAAGRSHVLVANHASLFDIPAVLAGIPYNLCFVLKRELTYVPIWGWSLLNSPYIVVTRKGTADARRAMVLAAERLRENERSVLFFPEGTRTRDGKLRSFKRGAFMAAINAGVPVVPLTINGTFGVLPKGKFMIRKGTVELVLGEPIQSAGLDEDTLLTRVRTEIQSHYVDQE